MNRNETDCKNVFEIYNERPLFIKIQILFMSSHCLSLIKPKKNQVSISEEIQKNIIKLL